MDILIPAERIQQRIVELAREIERDHPYGEVHLVGVLKGGFMFMADLIRAMQGRVTVDFMALSSYGKSSKSSGVTWSGTRTASRPRRLSSVVTISGERTCSIGWPTIPKTRVRAET